MDYRTTLMIKGKVSDSISNFPLDGVSIKLKEGFSKEFSDGIDICVTEDDGTFFGTYERKWGRKRNGINV